MQSILATFKAKGIRIQKSDNSIQKKKKFWKQDIKKSWPCMITVNQIDVSLGQAYILPLSSHQSRPDSLGDGWVHLNGT